MIEPAVSDDALLRLVDFLARRRRLVALTGAGVSTESGIPDYRDAGGAWKRPEPMRYQVFVGSIAARQRYWGRALLGWRMFATVEPNAAHRAFARLEQLGRVGALITQNVDGLHQRAGSRRVIDLHGRIDAVECLDCRRALPRAEFQATLEHTNPAWSTQAAMIAPDGDAVLDEAAFEEFRVPDCGSCGGIVKPAVVFFGESVPRSRVTEAMAALDVADGLLIAGTSLMVYSGYRFLRAAKERSMTVALVNLGRTRGDDEVDLRVTGACGTVLPAAIEQLADAIA
jgi:NAD-dependent SIR2 family protein deacetylase